MIWLNVGVSFVLLFCFCTSFRRWILLLFINITLLTCLLCCGAVSNSNAFASALSVAAQNKPIHEVTFWSVISEHSRGSTKMPESQESQMLFRTCVQQMQCLGKKKNACNQRWRWTNWQIFFLKHNCALSHGNSASTAEFCASPTDNGTPFGINTASGITTARVWNWKSV